MAGVLRNAPGATDIRIKTSAVRGLTYPVIEYSSLDERGRRHLTDIELFEVSGLEDEKYVFDLSNKENDPIAPNLLAEWEIKCHSGVGDVHNDRG